MIASISETAADLGYVTGWAAVQRMPETAARRLFRSAANLEFRRNTRQVQQLRRNLAIAMPHLTHTEVDDLTHRGMQSYGRYWCEVFRLPRWSVNEIEERLIIHDLHVLDKALAHGRGVVVVMAHIGNWDHLAAWSIVHGLNVTTVVERLKPEQLFRRFVAFREGLGLEVVSNVGDDKLFDKLQARLNSGGVVALVADRDLTSTGITVDFLDHPATMPVGPALLSQRTGAVVIPAWSWYDDTHTHLQVGEPLTAPEGAAMRQAVASITQQFADRLGAIVRSHPQDWHMLQPMWAAEVDGRAKAEQ